MKRRRKRKHSVDLKQVPKKLIFGIAAITISIFLLSNGNGIFGSTEQTTDNAQEQQTDDLHWKIYPVDIAVLVFGCGFCGIQIIKERKKRKEGL